MAVIARGHVRDRPFARTIHALAAKRFGGDFVLEHKEGAVRVSWRDGWAVAAESFAPADDPGQAALRAGLVTPAQLEEARRKAAAQPGASVLAVLAQAVPLTEEQIAAVKRQALGRAALRLFAGEDASFVLDSDSRLAPDAQVTPLDARWIIYAGLRTYYSEARLERELSFLAGQAIQLTDAAATALDAFGFVAAEKASALLLRKRPIALAQIASALPTVPRPQALALVYALAATDCLQIVAAAPAAPRPTPRGAATPTPPADRGTVATDRVGGRAAQARALIAAKVAELDRDADHFTLLGVGEDVSLADLRRAYFGLAKTMHPDRLRALQIDDRGADSQRLFAAINQAFATLSSDRLRSNYLATLRTRRGPGAGSGDVEEIAAKLIAAEEHVQRGLIALRRHHFPEAVGEFRGAIEQAPNEGEHHALYAWATWCASSDKDSIAGEVSAELRRAIDLSPRCVSAYYFRGQIAKQTGNLATAKECFRKVLELQPNHHDAELELRLLRRRSEKDTTGRSGLFRRKP